MRCENPLDIRLKDGAYVVDSDGKGYYTQYVQVPCGKCFACMSNLRADWTFRLKAHLRNALSAYFVTLTYSDEALLQRLANHMSDTERDQHTPAPSALACSLDKQRLKNFFHAFRNNIENSYQKSLSKEERGKVHHRIKYFAVGEYGDLTQRPHYHFILFDYKYDNIHLMKDIEEVWKEGHIDIRYCSDKLCSYITKYMLKSFDDDFKLEEGLEPPFRLVSKGLGLSYVTPQLARYLMNGGKPFLSDGTCKRRVPRYYQEKLAKEIRWQQFVDNEEPFVGAPIDCGSDGIRRTIFTTPVSQFVRDKEKREFDKYGFEYERIQVEKYAAYKRNTKKVMENKKSKI